MLTQSCQNAWRFCAHPHSRARARVLCTPHLGSMATTSSVGCPRPRRRLRTCRGPCTCTRLMAAATSVLLATVRPSGGVSLGAAVSQQGRLDAEATAAATAAAVEGAARPRGSFVTAAQALLEEQRLLARFRSTSEHAQATAAFAHGRAVAGAGVGAAAGAGGILHGPPLLSQQCCRVCDTEDDIGLGITSFAEAEEHVLAGATLAVRGKTVGVFDRRDAQPTQCNTSWVNYQLYKKSMAIPCCPVCQDQYMPFVTSFAEASSAASSASSAASSSSSSSSSTALGAPPRSPWARAGIGFSSVAGAADDGVGAGPARKKATRGLAWGRSAAAAAGGAAAEGGGGAAAVALGSSAAFLETAVDSGVGARVGEGAGVGAGRGAARGTFSKKAGGLYNKAGASALPGGALGGCCRVCPQESDPYMSLLETASEAARASYLHDSRGNPKVGQKTTAKVARPNGCCNTCVPEDVQAMLMHDAVPDRGPFGMHPVTDQVRVLADYGC